MHGSVKYVVRDGLAYVILNRPEVMNALNGAMKADLIGILGEAKETDDVKAVIITGEGDKAFCAGQDLGEAHDYSADDVEGWISELGELYKAVREFPKPTVMAVNGYAVGAGFQLCLLGDIRISGENAKYGMPEVNVGIPCITGSALLWHVVGAARTVDLILTGRMIDAYEAHLMGITTKVVKSQDLSSEAESLAHELASKDADVVLWNKRWVNSLTNTVYQQGFEFARKAHKAVFATGKPRELMRRYASDSRKRAAGPEAG